MTGLCEQSSDTSGHKMSLPRGGQVDILLERQSASQPACQLSKCQTCEAAGWSDIWWQEDRGPDYFRPLSRVPALPLVPLGGVTYLTKARQVTQMSSVAHYTPLALL